MSTRAPLDEHHAAVNEIADSFTHFMRVFLQGLEKIAQEQRARKSAEQTEEESTSSALLPSNRA